MLNSVHVVIHLPQKWSCLVLVYTKALLSFNCNRSRNYLISLTIFFFLGNYTSATPSCAVTMRRSNFFTTSCPLMLWITSVSPTSSQPSVSLTLYSMNNQLLWISVHCVTFVFPSASQWSPTTWWLFRVRSWVAPCSQPTLGCVFLVSWRRPESCRSPEILWRLLLRLVLILL